MSDWGIVNLNKPAGLTSRQAVSRVARTLGVRRAGHCGTLDPTATGVLLVCLGPATRLADYLQALPKTYRCVMKLGERTDTQDAAGRVIERTDPSGISEEAVRSALSSFRGEIEQVPPMFSAVKRDGVPLYRLARKGKTVRREARRVTVHELSVDRVEPPFVAFTVRSSKGLYVRTLCDDAGRILGVGAHLHSLVRSAVGDFRVEDAVGLDELTADRIIPPGRALDFLPCCRVPRALLPTVENGGSIPMDPSAFDRLPGPDAPLRLETEDGRLLGIGRLAEGRVRVRRLLRESPSRARTNL